MDCCKSYHGGACSENAENYAHGLDVSLSSA
jgi:hypothetical protein